MDIAKYSFYPWLRRGLSTKIIASDNIGDGSPNPGMKPRAETSIAVNVFKDSTAETVSKNIELIGPGDIIGINSNAIIKMEPRNWVTNFEPNYLPYIDFYDEEFPWRYSPASPNNNRLRPWLFLIVLKEDEFTRMNLPGSVLPVINIKDIKKLPLKNEIWAWAHVHLNDSLKNASELETALRDNPNLGCSRILCPRCLEAKQGYHAFLIPTFETGRLAGLGRFGEIQSLDSQLSSWDISVNDSNFPVYYESYFSTGETGDFETLVRKLKPKDANPEAGKREIRLDTFSYPEAVPNTDIFFLEGALKTNTSTRKDFLDPELKDFRDKVADFINTNTTLNADIPIITPPIYGKWHILHNTPLTSDAGWINELNLDPRNRTAAGFGCEVVRKKQDYYMKLAWEQLEKVNEANRLLMATAFASKVSDNLFAKHIEKQDSEKFFSVTSPVHKEIKIGGQSLQNTALYSSNAGKLSNHSFRKVSNSAGTVLRRLSKSSAKSQQVFSVSKMLTTVKTPSFQMPINEVFQKINSMSLNTHVVDNIAPAGFMNSVSSNDISIFKANLNSAFNNFKNNLTHFIGNIEIDAPQLALNLNTVKLTVVNEYHDYYKNNGFARDQIRLNGAVRLLKYTIPVMAYPIIDIPMYTELRDLSLECFFPNIDLIPNNSIVLFETNNRFIESFMAGLNYEMARELLWREYPTDQRGSYFRLFWNKNTIPATATPAYDIKEINNWNSQLGNNAPVPGQNNLVLSIKGDLLKKYPNTVIYLAQQKDNHTFHNELYPIFGAKVEPDIFFMGFDKTKDEIKGASKEWFFIIQERPGEVRFGLDVGKNIKNIRINLSPDTLSWDNVSTDNTYIGISASDSGNLATNGWGKDSAHMASIFYQKPVLIAIPANELLPA
ncbi:MAG TPA: hypothetical protein PK850_12750 [Ignavibacteria bacterium]|nr:hypothetical protein [Ignavibacteria bacterium]HRJ84838.1 hypothetical protein [Ignavibacteria bacterium]